VSQELAEYIVRETLRDRDPNDIVRQVAFQGRMNWQEAERFVNRVLMENRQAIMSRRQSTYRVVALIVLLMGLAGSFAGAYVAINGTDRARPAYVFLFVISASMVVGVLRWFVQNLRRLE